MAAQHKQVRAAWYRQEKRLSVTAPTAPTVDPAADRPVALARLAELTGLDAGIPQATRTRLLEPSVEAPVTIVVWHGFATRPPSSSRWPNGLRDASYVLLPRMPHHGLPDLLNRELASLTEAELVGHVDTTDGILTAGLGDEVWVARPVGRRHHGGLGGNRLDPR